MNSKAYMERQSIYIASQKVYEAGGLIMPNFKSYYKINQDSMVLAKEETCRLMDL